MTNRDDAARGREREREKIFLQCERFLFGHGPQWPRAVLAELAAEARPDEEPDRYGEGSLQPNLFAYVGWVVLSLAFAYLNWRFVERPCRKWILGLWPKPATREASDQTPLRRAA